MKRYVSVAVLVVFLASILVAGCGGSKSADKPAASKKIELSAATGGMSQSSPAGKAFEFFAKKVEEYSEGSIKVKVFYDSQLGDATSQVKGLQQGTVDIAATGNSYFAALVPELQVFELPFMFDSYEKARAAVDGPVGQKIVAKFEGKGLKPLAFWEIGFRHLTNNTRPVKTPDDLKGVKIRTLPAPVQVKAWESLGAMPTPIDFSELYTALQQGVVDAQENPLNLIRSTKFYEVQKHLTLTGHVYTPMMMAISTKTWDRLDAKQREAILKATKETQAYERSLVKDGEADDLAAIEKAGVKVEKTPDLAAFKKLGTKAWSVFTDKYGDELVKELAK